MNDEEFFESLKLDQQDSVELWPGIARKLPARVSAWEFLTPLAAAAAAVVIVSQVFGGAHQAPKTAWPVREVVLVQIAEVKTPEF